ncbi:hypothetical protein KAK07_22640 [Ideonella sp. 4Y16]|uniref:Spore coat protein U domain-containing protein n=1 Tax=Ideonella aquatica TaxID=2824119 RepID=A0A941BM41_9BURK|nr:MULTISPECIES: hypothetical protein [Ideonella]MBQ0946157.1 hypothetical protein [Ideonella alba]MBQ0960419.1 hypothetical protein [Ideonella aquatica]
MAWPARRRWRLPWALGLAGTASLGAQAACTGATLVASPALTRLGVPDGAVVGTVLWTGTLTVSATCSSAAGGVASLWTHAAMGGGPNDYFVNQPNLQLQALTSPTANVDNPAWCSVNGLTSNGYHVVRFGIAAAGSCLLTVTQPARIVVCATPAPNSGTLGNSVRTSVGGPYAGWGAAQLGGTSWLNPGTVRIRRTGSCTLTASSFTVNLPPTAQPTSSATRPPACRPVRWPRRSWTAATRR